MLDKSFNEVEIECRKLSIIVTKIENSIRIDVFFLNKNVSMYRVLKLDQNQLQNYVIFQITDGG